MFESDRQFLKAVSDVFREVGSLVKKTYHIQEDDIRHLAFCLWKEAGEPEGRSDYFWFKAQNILRGRCEHVFNK